MCQNVPYAKLCTVFLEHPVYIIKVVSKRVVAAMRFTVKDTTLNSVNNMEQTLAQDVP